MALQRWAIVTEPMWCHERKGRLRAVLSGVTSTLIVVLAWVGSAAAIESQPPTLKVSGKATFGVEARAVGEGFEVSAVLSDEVGRPLPGAEVRVRESADAGNASLHRCGAPRADLGGELLLTTDSAGRVCVSVTGMPSGSVELAYQDARGYFERASRVVRLPSGVATSFEVGFDPPLTTLSLDRAVQELGLVVRGASQHEAPAAAELVLALAESGAERELGRVPLDGLGEVHRLSVVSTAFGQPGPARLVARLVARDGAELARASSAVLRTATVTLALEHEHDSGVEPGAVLQLRAASALGPAPTGVIEAQSRGVSIAAAAVRKGAATLTLPSTPSALFEGGLTLEYIGGGSGWIAGPPIEVQLLPPSPSYGRYVLWILAAALAALAAVLSWRRPARVRPGAAPPPARPRASVEVLETFGAGGGYRGLVRDAHEGFPISPAVVRFLGPGPGRPVLLELRTSTQGSFELETADFPRDTQVEVTAPFHATLIAPLPVPGVIELSLISRRRALLERLVRWAERRGRPWTAPVGEPTPEHIAAIATSEGEAQVERWARRVEYLAYGPQPPDAASEQAAGVMEDPTVRQDSGID